VYRKSCWALQCKQRHDQIFANATRTKDNAAKFRGVVANCQLKRAGAIAVESSYFDTDFLNIRSIFSLVASQQA